MGQTGLENDGVGMPAPVTGRWRRAVLMVAGLVAQLAARARRRRHLGHGSPA